MARLTMNDLQPDEFKFACPRCGQHFLAERNLSGTEFKCHACGTMVVVPNFDYSPTTPDPSERNTSAIKTSRPNCGATYDIGTEYIRETVTCGTCAKEFVVSEILMNDAAEVLSSGNPIEDVEEDAAGNITEETNKQAIPTVKKGMSKSFSEKAKAVAISAKGKVILLWKNGWKGRVVIIGFAALLTLCLFVPLLSYRSADTNYESDLRHPKGGDVIAKDVVKASELFRTAAKPGNVDAQYKNHSADTNYESSLQSPKGEDSIAKDAVNASELFRTAAKPRNVDAQYQNRSADTNYELGLRYLKGDGIAKDVVKARKLFLTAAKQGNVDAQYKIGSIYGSLQDWEDAAKWYQAASDQGHSEAKLVLGFCYIFGLGVSKDEPNGMQLLNEAKQDSQLQDQIQDLLNHIRLPINNLPCNNGNVAMKDNPTSVELLRLIAELGNAEAQVALGLCYYNGESVTKNDNEAMKWFQRAAAQGEAGAQCLLGLGYASGTGVPKDMHEAVKWLVKAGNQGQTKAQLELASLYFLGNGVERDYRQSMKWCRMAADQGDPDAQYMYGSFYRIGLGVSVDLKEAVRWYHKAAEQGYSKAQNALYEIGKIPQQHETKKPTKAFKWYDVL